MKKLIRKLIDKTRDMLKWIWRECRDWRTLLLFVIIALVLSFEVWGFYLLGFILHNAWFHATASVCWLFWLGPGTPFIPLCMGLTLGIKKIKEKIDARRRSRS